MADILVDVQGTPSTPSAGTAIIFVDTNGKILGVKNEAGIVVSARSENASVAAQGPGFASDTYVTNSDIQIPSFLQAGAIFRWTISVSKTAAGIATPVYTIRIGSNRTTADTARLTLTGPAQTAAADVAVINIYVVVRSVGASGVLQGTTSMDHNLAATGFANNAAGLVEATSAGFDNTALAGQFIGLSINGGASAAWTITQVRVEAKW